MVPSVRHPLWEEGARAWPEIRLEPGLFERHVRRLGGARPQHLTDLYLACACAEADPWAVQHLDAVLLPRTVRALKRLASSPQERAELQQRLREVLLMAREDGSFRLASYTGRGSLVHWLKATATRVALNQRRSQRVEVLGERSDRLDNVAASGDVELGFIRARYRPQFQKAFEAAVAGLSVRERAVLRFHLLEGLGTDQLGELYQVHRTTVARWLADARAQLLQETRRGLAEALQLPRSELTSLLRVLRSQLDVSVRKLL